MNEKLTFFEALERVVGTSRKIKCQHVGIKDFRYWSQYKVLVVKGRPIAMLEMENESTWWPTMEEQKEKAWEVETEPVYVWGQCDLPGGSWLSHSKKGIYDQERFNLPINDLFSKVKAQKYKLVPVDD